MKTKKVRKLKGSINEIRSDSLAEVLALLYVTILILAMFLKILFG